MDKYWENGKNTGTTYAALSRVKSLSSCVIIEPISYERLTSIKSSKTLEYRLNEEVRLDKMAEITFNKFQ
jgi:hypothetical protein